MKWLKFFQGRREEQSTSPNKGRYWAVLGFMLVMLTLILLRTSSLQLKSEGQEMALSRGDGAQMTVHGARGDIVDRQGRPIAYSLEKKALYLANANLSNEALNRELLAIANLLDQNGIKAESKLSDYFDFSYEKKDLSDADKQTAPFVFKKDLDEIEAWQSSPNLFNLQPLDSLGRGRKVILKPQEFYDYLLYDLFKIEDRQAGGDLHYSRAEAYRIMQLRYTLLEHNWTFVQGEPIKLASGISDGVAAKIQEQNDRFKACLLVPESERKYAPEALFMANVLGYTGEISAEEYELLKNDGYRVKDRVGKAGIEYAAERYLRGRDGFLPYGAWMKQEGKGEHYVEGRYSVQPKAGAEIKLTLDADIQKVAVASILDSVEEIKSIEYGNPVSASVVAMDLKSGAIIAMASLPTYDPRDFEQDQKDPKAEARIKEYLLNGKMKPLLNRCIGEIYAPGSTFKPFTAAAGVMEKVITPQDSYFTCNGTEEIGHKMWSCYEKPIHGHGRIDLAQGLVTSCNLYFYKLGLGIGIDHLSEWAKRFGLGEYTGIDLPGEARGIRPSKEVKRQTRALAEDQLWYPADTCQTAIGQFDNAYTLMQMCRGIGGIATGRLWTPHVIKEIRDADGSLLRPEQIRSRAVGINQTAIDMVKNGMRQLKFSGSGRTARNFADYPIDVSAKTGTAEVGADPRRVDANALFVCFAPTDKPEIAIAVVVEGGGKGDLTSYIARDVLDAYFKLPQREAIQKRLQNLNFAAMQKPFEKFLLKNQKEEEEEEREHPYETFPWETGIVPTHQSKPSGSETMPTAQPRESVPVSSTMPVPSP